MIAPNIIQEVTVPYMNCNSSKSTMCYLSQLLMRGCSERERDREVFEITAFSGQYSISPDGGGSYFGRSKTLVGNFVGRSLGYNRHINRVSSIPKIKDALLFKRESLFLQHI